MNRHGAPEPFASVRADQSRAESVNILNPLIFNIPKEFFERWVIDCIPRPLWLVIGWNTMGWKIFTEGTDAWYQYRIHKNKKNHSWHIRIVHTKRTAGNINLWYIHIVSTKVRTENL